MSSSDNGKVNEVESIMPTPNVLLARATGAICGNRNAAKVGVNARTHEFNGCRLQQGTRAPCLCPTLQGDTAAVTAIACGIGPSPFHPKKLLRGTIEILNCSSECRQDCSKYLLKMSV